jgi:Transposase zinc-binding domain/Putative transposase
MTPDSRAQKNRFKQIFLDGWEDFKQNHPRYAAVDAVVRKMLGCGDPVNGHALYVCPDCQARRVVAFSCKSQFCLSCAKVYGHTWVTTVQAMLHPGITYRHLILTVPQAVWTMIYQHAAELLSGLMLAAQTTMDAVVRQAKRQVVKLGYIVVLQTAGRAASYNPHLHIIMTDGGLRADGSWQRLGYVPYDLLHRLWQRHVLDLITTRLAGNPRAQAVVAEMRRRYPKGFVAHLQGNVLPRMQQLTRYLVKYVLSPPIALSRIIAYDRAQGMVTVLVPRSSQSREEDDRDGESGDVYRASGTAHFAQGVSAHPLLWLTSDLYAEEDARATEDGAARCGATGHGYRRCADHATALSRADALCVRPGSAGLSALWRGDVAVAGLVPALWGGL